MKNKGFTLIELLAVIVILAIIALIATPMILNVVEKSRKGAAESSALGYIDAVEKQMMINLIDSDSTNDITDGVYETSNLEVSVKGEKPSEGWVQIEKGKVVNYSLKIGNYYVNPKDGNISTVFASKKGRITTKPGVTHKGIVYLDPTDLTKTCNKELASANINSDGTLTGIKTGCMKWYIFDDSGDTYKMILDHNTTRYVAWNSSGKNSEGMKEVADKLITDTTGWDDSLNPRLITADEIATITKQTKFDKTNSGHWFYFDSAENSPKTKKAFKQGENKYAWLFDYTSVCISSGCNAKESSVIGYWTSTPVGTNQAWSVYNVGGLVATDINKDDPNSGSNRGIRPVITINKNVID